MAITFDNGLEALVLVDETHGVTVIPQLAELRRLNWFDGKLLRADDLRVEQDHVRALVRRANRAGGHGVVQGFSCSLAADGRLSVGPGLAIDPGGRSLLLPMDVGLDVQDLIDRTAGRPRRAVQAPRRARRQTFGDCVEPEPAGEVPVGGARWYVVTVGWAEGLCGNEEVYGRLCEDACTTSTDRPWRIDGLVFRAHPLRPRTPLAGSSAVALSAVHERSLLAAAVFADELADAGSLIFGDGLRSPVWCAGAAPADPSRDEVPLAVIARAGGATRFLDLWIARRERIEPPPQRYWDGRLAMRSWDVFLAQVLQFQCQLRDLLGDGTPGGAPQDDPCAERQRALEDTFAELERRGEDDPRIALLRKRVVALRAAARAGAQRILVDGGIVELPPAGYLPVDPTGPPSLEEQVRALMGAGVDLTFCAARHDALARAFEAARHLDRISLLRGLDDPARREAVEVIVPDAELEEIAARDAWEGVLRIGGDDEGEGGEEENPRLAERAVRAARERRTELGGAGRVEHRGALAVRWAGVGSPPSAETEAGRGPSFGAFGEVSTDRDPFRALEGERLAFSGAGDAAGSRGETVFGQRVSLHGTFLVRAVEQRPGGMLLRGVVDGIATTRQIAADGSEESDSLTASHWPAQLQRRPTDDGGTLAALRVQVDKETTVTVTLEWHGDADSVEVVAYVASLARVKPTFVSRASAFGREVARLTLDREPGAGTPGHPARTGSEDALKLIERAVREPGYAAEVRRRLFGGDDSGVRLRPTRDWVLFRRRAVMRCGPVTPVVTATDTFAVYAVDNRVSGVITHVPRAGGFAYIGEVAFEQGATRIARGAEALVRGWDDVVGEGVISAAGVLAGAPGGDDLGLRRLESAVDALGAVTPRSAQYESQVVERDSVPVDPRGADGILIVGFEPRAVATIVTAVAYVEPGIGSRYKSSVEDGDFQQAMKIAFGDPHVLGTIRFPEDSAEPADAAELEAVVNAYRAELGQQPVELADVLWVKGAPGTGEDAQKGRGGAVIDALSGGPVRLHAVTETELGPARDQGVQESTVIVLVPLG